MNPSTHIIGRQRVLVRYSGKTDHQSLRDMVHNICRNELPARLTQLLDRLDNPAEVIRIKTIDVDLSLNDDGHLEEKLARALVEELEIELRKQLQYQITEAHPAEQNLARILAFYLNRGFLPWWSTFQDRRSIANAIKDAWSTDSSVQNIWKQIRDTLTEPAARKRLLDLIDLSMFEQLGKSASIFDTTDWKNVVESIVWLDTHFNHEKALHSFLRKAQSALLSILAKHNSTTLAWMMFDEEFNRLFKSEHLTVSTIHLPQISSTHIRSVLLETRINESVSKNILTDSSGDERVHSSERTFKKNTRNKMEKEETKGISVPNAGLVLVASYLPRFFENLRLVQDNTLEAPSKAAVILRKLVFPDTPFEEFELVLEKVLCGIPLQESVSDVPLDEIALKEESDELLKAVIGHWNALKNTSPDGLRQAFLQREGRLTETDHHWNLEVQKVSYDLLLERLPWNFRMIKLPWMNKILQVSWG